ncbi:MAG TPA: PilZ domain-containing protein, partial [Nitrospira sp.]|nr:PilZ domain-containing protein [Nitrospira sp.]
VMDGYNQHRHEGEEMARFPHTRSYKRFLFHSPLIVGGESCVCEGTLRDLSMHGCSMVCDREFILGSKVRASLLLPDQTSALSIELGRITWVKGRECGVEFMQLPLQSRLRLNRTLRIPLIQSLNAWKNRE